MIQILRLDDKTPESESVPEPHFIRPTVSVPLGELRQSTHDRLINSRYAHPLDSRMGELLGETISFTVALENRLGEIERSLESLRGQMEKANDEEMMTITVRIGELALERDKLVDQLHQIHEQPVEVDQLLHDAISTDHDAAVDAVAAIPAGQILIRRQQISADIQDLLAQIEDLEVDLYDRDTRVANQAAADQQQLREQVIVLTKELAELYAGIGDQVIDAVPGLRDLLEEGLDQAEVA